MRSNETVRQQKLPRRYWCLVNMVVWAAVVTWLLLNQFFSLLISGSIVPIIVALGVIILGKK